MRKKVLITVLTYPQPSTEYVETVCAAGFDEDGNWIRIYPIKMRMLENGILHKWNWYEFDVSKRPAHHDFRKESYHCDAEPDGKTLGTLTANAKDGWRERKERTIDKGKIYTSMDQLLSDSDPKKRNFISLATFKPQRIVDLEITKWDVKKTHEVFNKKIAIMEKEQQAPALFSDMDIPSYFQMAETIPYQFNYVFEDDKGKRCSLMIEDWELFSLFRKYYRSNEENYEQAVRQVRTKYLDEFKEKDLYLFLGTRFNDHRRNWKNPYALIGFFYPPYTDQLTLGF